MKTMRDVAEILSTLGQVMAKAIPDFVRISIQQESNGIPNIFIFTRKKYVPIYLEESDWAKDMHELALEIAESVKTVLMQPENNTQDSQGPLTCNLQPKQYELASPDTGHKTAQPVEKGSAQITKQQC